MIKIFFFLTLSLLIGCEKAVAMKIEKPSYYVKLTMSNCPRMVAVNGVEIERDFSGDANHSEYPINHYLKSGENTLEILVGEQEFMESSTDSSSICKAEVFLRGNVDGKKVNYKITDIFYTPKYTDNASDLYKKSSKNGEFFYKQNNEVEITDKKGDFSVGSVALGPAYIPGSGVSLGRSFTADLPFQKWMFFDGDTFMKLPITDDSYDDYKDIAKKLADDIWILFEKEKVDEILSLFENRSSEIDQAFYKKPGTTQKELRESIEHAYKKDYLLDDIENDKMQLMASFDGRLISIVDAGNSAGTIYFYDEDSDSYSFYTIYWMKKDGKWIIAR